MWNLMNPLNMGHSGNFSVPPMNQKRNFSLHLSSVAVLPGKGFKNPNFVNENNPSVHNYLNNFISTPVQKISCGDSYNGTNNQFLNRNFSFTNSSQSIIDTIKEKHLDIIPYIASKPDQKLEDSKSSDMCYGRKRTKRNRKNRRAKIASKSSKPNNSRRELNEMMEIDLEFDNSANASDINTSPKAPRTLNLTEFIGTYSPFRKCFSPDLQTKLCEENNILPVLISRSPPNISTTCIRERKLSLAESEDSFIVFDSGTDEELEFSDDSDEAEDECGSEYEEDLDSSSSAIPIKRVRFPDDDDLCEIHRMVQWSFAYQQARKGPWEEYARDRDRFKKRISDTEKIMEPIFQSQHRQNVFRERFQSTFVDN